MRLLLLCAWCMPAAFAQTPLATTVKWRADRNIATASTYSLNLFSAPNPNLITTAYKTNLDYMKPGLVRIHSAAIVNPSTNGSSWLNADNASWNTTRINQVFTNLGTHGGDRLMGMPGWPASFNAAGSNKLDSAKVTAYANLCASLVLIVNAPGSGRYVKYWEPFNEKENFYYDNLTNSTALTPLANIHNQCAMAMKAVDPTIIVGGPALQNPYPSSNNSGALDRFIQTVNAAGHLGFFSYHNYGTSGANITAVSAYDKTPSIGALMTTYRTRLTTAGVPISVPIYLGETNIYDTWSNDGTARQMISMTGAIFDALVMKHAVESGNAGAVMMWNEKDGSFGKTLDNDTLNPGARVLHAFNNYFQGTQVAVTTGNNKTGEVFAVKNGNKKCVMLINRSDTTTTAAVDVDFMIDFNGWSPSSTAYNIHTISGTSGNSTVTSTGATWVGNPTITVAANTLRFLEFTDVVDPNQIVLNPEADSYVSSGSPSTPASNNINLNVYGTSTESFLRFDVSNLGGPISSARIRLYLTVLNSSATHRLDQVTNNTWGETTMTWNTKPPATGTYLGTWTPSKTVPVDIDVTALAQTAAASADQKISFRISSATAGADMRYGARENTAEFRPELVILRSTEAAVVTSSSPATGGTTSGGGTYNIGSSVTVVATASSGSAFLNWTEGTTAASNSPSYSFTVGGNRTLVANFQMTFASWAGSKFTPEELLDPAISGTSADPEHDGIDNLMEYALNSDPRIQSLPHLPYETLQNGVLSLTYRRNKEASDLIFNVGVSSDLATWHFGTGYTSVPAVVNEDLFVQTLKVTDLSPPSSTGRKFIRLDVTAP